MRAFTPVFDGLCPAMTFLVALLALTTPALAAGVFEERKPQCLACHGENGVSQTPATPSLGGQPELYLLFQLVAFRDRTRKVEIMNEMAKGMTDDDIRAAAALIAKMPPPPAATEQGDAARMANGKALAEKHRCGFCHNADLAGHDQIPRIARQREDYLLLALRDYKTDKRFGSGAAMNEVVHPLSEQELADLAHYVAHLR
jgi:cytochrome c553